VSPGFRVPDQPTCLRIGTDTASAAERIGQPAFGTPLPLASISRVSLNNRLSAVGDELRHRARSRTGSARRPQDTELEIHDAEEQQRLHQRPDIAEG
jgi:hypothetical protein